MTLKRNFSKQLEAFESRHVHMELGPAALYVESVKGCPFSCAMCHFKKSKPKNMSRALLEKIEPFFKDLEVMAIHGQGEPLLGDIEYFVEQSVKNDFVLHMNTTGFLLTKRTSDLLSSTRLSIRFSIHAGIAETYKRIMGHDLGRTKRNISYLVTRAKRSENGHDFWFSFIVMKENIDEIEEFLHLAQDCGVESVRFMRLIPNWQSVKGVRMKDRQFKFKYSEQFNRRVRGEFLRRLPAYQDLANKLGIKIEFGSIESHKGGQHPLREMMNSATAGLFGRGVFPLLGIPGSCLAPWFGQLVVNQKGDVRLCCATTHTLGNLKESTLPEIWNSNKMKAIRKAFAEGRNPKVCGYCKGFYFGNYPNNSFLGIPRQQREEV